MIRTSEGGLRVTVIGATGLVGREVVSLLGERRFPISELRLYSSDRTAGEEVDHGDDTLRAERLPRELPETDLAFLCATAELSAEIAEDLVDAGAIVVDLTDAHRGDFEVPLVMAGAVDAALEGRGGSRGCLVAVPDAPALLLAPALRAILGLTPLRRIVVTALVSASAFGREEVNALGRASAALLSGDDPEEEEGRPPIAFSALPAGTGTGAHRRHGIERDLRRLLALDARVTVTMIRVPAFHGHAASVSVETLGPVGVEALRVALREAPSVLLDDVDGQTTGTRDAVGSEAVHLGDLRVDPDDPGWIHFWVAADNLRQGAALNAVAVAEALTRRSGSS